MTKTITRVYSDYAAAELAVRELKAAGLGDSHIGIVASNADGWHKPGGSDVDPRHDKDRDGKDDRAEGAVTGGAIGKAATDSFTTPGTVFTTVSASPGKRHQGPAALPSWRRAL